MKSLNQTTPLKWHVKKFIGILSVFIGMASAFHPWSIFAADSPTLIPFQGRLTLQDGTVITNGTYTIRFALYDQAVGGSALWLEEHKGVAVINGMVNAFLGGVSNSLSTVSFDTVKHLGITVDDGTPAPDPEMIPRQMIIPAFWAKNAEKLDGHDWSAILDGSGDPSTGKILGSKIQPGGITSNQLAASTITGTHVLDGSLTALDIDVSNLQITASNIVNGTISLADMGSESVGLANLYGQRSAPVTNAVVDEVALSSEIVSLTFSGTTDMEVPGLEVTLHTTGRPVYVSLISAAGQSAGIRFSNFGSNNSPFGVIHIYRDGVEISTSHAAQSINNSDFYLPPSSFHTVDFPPPGQHIYKVYVKTNNGTTSINLYRVRLVAFEL